MESLKTPTRGRGRDRGRGTTIEGSRREPRGPDHSGGFGRHRRNQSAPRGPDSSDGFGRRRKYHQSVLDPISPKRIRGSDEISSHSSESYFTFAALANMSNMKSDDAVIELAKKKTACEQMFNGNLLPNNLVMTLRVLANVCRANFTEIVVRVLSQACMTSFLKSIEHYILRLSFEESDDTQTNQLYWADKNKFWQNLVEILNRMNVLLPSTVHDHLTNILGTMCRVIPSIEEKQKYKIEQNVKDFSSDLLNELNIKIARNYAKSVAAQTSSKQPIEPAPPEDFRELSIIPTRQDLNDDSPFIRASRVRDAYISVDHYLDVQFRLLREDFIAPLRNGMQEYLQGTVEHIRDVRVYKNVRLYPADTKVKGVGVILSFGTMKRVNWARSKRFIFGGLLCLSKDHFETILFLTVSNRDEERLRRGEILAEPCENTNITADLYDSNFVMIECKLYFEPYLAVLQSMRRMSETNFPMRRYLVEAQATSSIPEYLRNNVELLVKNEPHTSREQCQYLEPCPGLMIPKTIFGVRTEVEKDANTNRSPSLRRHLLLPIGKDENWPTADQLHLDESQYEAYKCALSEEFAIIQGPPGTGKTFIALKIIETLLKNPQYWKPKGPIVVVCLTNHALDQFLEGISKFTSSIVRVGSRSRTAALEQYTLANRRQKSNVHKGSNEWYLMHDLKRDLEDELDDLRDVRAVIQALKTPDAIVSVDILKKYVPGVHLNSDEELLANLGILGIRLSNTNSLSSTSVSASVEHINETSTNNFGEDENRIVDAELELYSRSTIRSNDHLIFPLSHIDRWIDYWERQIVDYEKSFEPGTSFPFSPISEYAFKISQLLNLRKFVVNKLSQHPLIHRRSTHQSQRWAMYWKWVKIAYAEAIRKMIDIEKKYRLISVQLNEAKQMVDMSILKYHCIVGLTTAAAAKLHASLRALQAPIVLVEEAAEILEAHVVCSMTEACEHVILIGDHKQLRPKAATIKLGKKYNLNVSLFERMLNIKGSCAQLAHQYRMRPEIARLICPSIYQTLHNHESVLEYPPVKGLEKNLFFLSHSHREANSSHEDSWTNPYEAKFLMAFAKHLLLQGYDSTDITVLCTYTGQLFALNKEKANYSQLRNVRVTTVDNYQGEECTIILLSLVRNNEEGTVGFLREENRVCVALSRAREGLYILGNMENLTAHPSVWQKIKEVLEDEKAIGDAITLRCQMHPDEITTVRETKDFGDCPAGGCLKMCGAELKCGHNCTSICHILDIEHGNFCCKEPCERTCWQNHPCALACGKKCLPCQVDVDHELKCGHSVRLPCFRNPDGHSCFELVDATLPHCGHDVIKECYASPETYRCTWPCPDRLPCGHSCMARCHAHPKRDPDHLQYKCQKECVNKNVDCSMDHQCKKMCYEECMPCTTEVIKQRSCGHSCVVECSKNVEDIECKAPCKLKAPCGHDCKRKCCEPCDNCQVEVTKMSPCGHELKVKCCEQATIERCRGRCSKILACGHRCTQQCMETCNKQCKRMVLRKRPGLCGHTFTVPCYLQEIDNEQVLRTYCKEPCTTELRCGHICKGSCVLCNQGRIHQPCGENCGNILICGHRCEVACRQECPPCKQPCPVKCRHNKCNKKCGQPCAPCKELCNWRCRHSKCTKRCHEMCDREPCMEPCAKLLKCKHPCVGFCGDPCPPLCIICHKKELTEDFFLGEEDEPDARFVLLQDCGHCIESRGLLTWISQHTDSIQIKTCPRCKTPISTCMRIMNQIKVDFAHVEAVKKKVFGNLGQLQKYQANLLDTVISLEENIKLIDFPEWNALLTTMHSKLMPVRKQRRQSIHSGMAEANRIVIDFLLQIFQSLSGITSKCVKSYEWLKSQVAMLIKALPTTGRISNQEINDIELELRRLHYLRQLYNHDVVKSSNDGFVPTCGSYEKVELELLSTEKFTESREAFVRDELSKLHDEKLIVAYERKMIVKAMGLKQGHWFKCPNGHFYAIGECGGAMQVSKCNECGSTIGGQSHQLGGGNTLASEMDGAVRAAWPS